jgi:hypothetical protein
MVRKIVSTLIEVGKGRLAPTDIPEIFAAHDGSPLQPHGPPRLPQVALEYPDPTDLAGATAAARGQWFQLCVGSHFWSLNIGSRYCEAQRNGVPGRAESFRTQIYNLH